MGCPCLTALLLGLGVLGVYLLYNFIKSRSAAQKLERWSNTPKDVVILHGFPAIKTLPNGSPFILKVQTYLRMVKIQYQMDHKDMFGPKGKAPWISLNGQHIADSEMIIEFLNKKFEKNLNKNHDEKKIAIASSLRIMLDEHFVWGMALERLIFEGYSKVKKVMEFPLPLRMYLRYLVNSRSKAQGIGSHSEREIVQIMTKDLQIVSSILGNNKFICGDEPCELDAGIFGQLAQVVWALPDSPYEQLVNDELKNLKEYCFRMKEKYWPDWDSVLCT